MTDSLERAEDLLTEDLLLRSLVLLALLAITIGVGHATTPTSPEVNSPPAWWLRVIGTALGSLLVIYGLFTVPGDHKRYENYLVRWWVWVEEKREGGLPWFTAFLQVVTTLMTNAFDRVFGPRILSLEAAGASIALSVGCLSLTVGIVVLIQDWSSDSDLDVLYTLWPLVFGVGLVFIGLLRMISPKLTRYQLALASLTSVLFILGAISQDHARTVFVVRFLASFLIALVCSVTSDFFFVSLTRRLLRTAKERSAVTGVLLIGLIDVVAVGTVVLPFLPILSGLISVPGLKLLSLYSSSSTGPVTRMVLNAITLTSAFNMIDILVPLAIVMFALVMLLHRLIWPPLSRFLQVVSDEHILLKRWSLFWAGVGILCVTWPALDLVGKFIGLRSR